MGMNKYYINCIQNIIKFGFTVIRAAEKFRFVSGTVPLLSQSFYERSHSRELFPFGFIMSVCPHASASVSHPYKTTSKIIVLHTFIFKFLYSKLEDKRFCTEW